MWTASGCPEEAMHAILQKAKEDCPVKRKTSLMLVAVIVLLLGAATALAVTALHGLGFVGREMDGSVYSGTTDGQRLLLFRWLFAHGLAA